MKRIRSVSIFTTLLVLTWTTYAQEANRGSFGPDSTSGSATAPARQSASDDNLTAVDPWTAGLNAFFNVQYSEPSFDDIMAALAGHLNHQTLQNINASDSLKELEAAVRGLDKDMANHPDARLVLDVYRCMARWIDLESAHAQQPGDAIIRQSIRLVQDWAKIVPDADPARIQQILSTLETRKLFVPSSILFQRFILPSRNMPIPPECHVYEAPLKPAYYDAAHQAMATFDLLASPGPVCRLDFDTTGSDAAVLERSDDGKTFTEVKRWESNTPGGVQGPVIPDSAFRAPYVRLTAWSSNETAVLRNARLFALKQPPEALCSSTRQAPILDADFKEAAWPRIAQIEGFIAEQASAFAEMPTTVRLTQDGEALYLGAYMRESRMDTMHVTQAPRDAPLWEEESVEFIISADRAQTYRFIVNPKGCQFDSRNDDASWNGEWDAIVKDYPTGWAMEARFPFRMLGAWPSAHGAWRINVVRNRHNVTREHSVWSPGSPGGLIAFE